MARKLIAKTNTINRENKRERSKQKNIAMVYYIPMFGRTDPPDKIITKEKR